MPADDMTPQLYFPNEQDQDETYHEAIRATNPLYTSGTPTQPVCSQYQPGPWPHHASNEANIAESQSSWETQRIINDHGPVMFDWQTSPVGPWDMQNFNSVAVSHNGQGIAFQHHPADDGFQEAPLDFGRAFEQNVIWEDVHWTHDSSTVAEGGGEGRDRLETSLPVSHRAQSPGRAPKRRKRPPTSTVEIQSTATMIYPAHAQLPPDTYTAQLEAPEQLHYAPAPTFITPDYLCHTKRSLGQTQNLTEGLSPMTASSENIIQTMATSSTPPPSIFPTSPELIPSVRIISDRRETVTKLRRGSNAVFKTQSANARRGHYASEVWEGHKAAIKKMYIDEGKPLREVIKTMEIEHDFPATQRMYKARFKQWGLMKNNTEKVVSQILRTKFERDAAGKLSQFTRNGKDVNLQNYLQRKGLTEYDLVDFHPTTTGSDIGNSTTSITSPRLAYVRCRTPPSDIPADLRLPDRLRFQDTLVMSFKRAFLVWRQEEQASAFGFQPSVFTWRVTDFPHLSSLIESARLIRAGDGASGVAALNRAFRAMDAYLASMDATASFYFFFHRQSRPWQEDARIALAVWKFLAAYAAAARVGNNGGGISGGSNGGNHPLFHTFRLMYEVIQKEGVTGLRELLTECANTVADELERAFGRDHWLKDLIWGRCFPEKSKLRQMQLVRDLRNHGPTAKIVKRLY